MSVFIAQLFPKDKVKDIKGASQAGINFCHSFIEAIEPDVVYAYQLNSEQKKLRFDFGNEKIKYVVSRVFPHKSVLKGLNVLVENFRITGDIVKRREKNVWFYNMTPQVMMIFFMLRFLFRKKCFVVVADFTPGIFRNKLALKLLKRSSGIISLTPELKDIIANATRVEVKAGIINAVVRPDDRETVNRNSFLFSGSLGKYTGIELALEAFAELPGIQLYVSGRGDSENKVIQFSEKYPNIRFLGFLGYAEYVELLAKVDFVLSLRDTSVEKNLYNFPSKIIEYFIGNKIVISTKRYSTLDPESYIFSEYDKQQLKEAISRLVQLPDQEIRKMQSAANNFARENFSYQSWKDAVRGLEQSR